MSGNPPADPPPTRGERMDAFSADTSASITEMLSTAPIDTVVWTDVPPPIPAPVTAPAGRRSRARLLIGISAVAAVALVVGAVVVGLRLASQGDGSEEAALFAASEEALDAAQSDARAAHVLLTTAIARSEADVDAVAGVLSSLHGYVDTAALVAARDATSAYRTAVAALSPDPLDDFAASNPGGGDAVSLVRAQTEVATASTLQLTEALTSLASQEATFLAAITALGAAFPAAADAALVAAPDASAATRTAVSAAAAAVVAAQAAGGLGVDEMRAFPPAVEALRADQTLRAAEEEEEQPRPPTRRPGSGGAPVAPVAPVDPVVPPVDPGPVDPVDPGPTDPVEPTDPPAETPSP